MPRRVLYISIGHLCVVCAVIGIFVPLWPTTVFLILAAGAYARGSERFYRWLLDHPYLGPPVQDWYRHGVIHTRAKVIAVSMILVGLSIPVLFLSIPIAAKVSAVVVCGSVILFLGTRPSTPEQGSGPVSGWLGAPPQFLAEIAAAEGNEVDGGESSDV